MIKNQKTAEKTDAQTPFLRGTQGKKGDKESDSPKGYHPESLKILSILKRDEAQKDTRQRRGRRGV